MPSAWGGVGTATLAALPLAFLLVVAQVPRRGWRNPLLEAAMVLGTAPWLVMVLTPRGEGRALSLVPFADLAGQLHSAGAAVQIGGNLLVFAALGACLPLRWAGFASAWRVLLVGVTGSVLIELAQYVLAIGRVSSVDDVLLNALGAVLAAACTRRRAARGVDVG